MADKCHDEGSSSCNLSGESSNSVVELNIKTLDSQIYSFQVDKNIPVSLFKEKIARKIGIPVSQQRLIFRGKVLKDDQPLSEYYVESGHTLHLVERQPTQSQPSQNAASGENGSNGNRGNDNTTGAVRNRVGQISHSVVLGTFNVGDQGEGIVPDVTRVIGAVLNSFGIGTQPTTNITQASPLTNASGQSPQGSDADGMRGNLGGQNQAGHQMQSGQAFPGQPFQSSPQVVQVPLSAATAIPLPSFHVPVPDSLSTLLEFTRHMEQALSQNGYQPDNSSDSTGERPRVELRPGAQGLPTPEALSTVMRQAQRLLSGNATAALSHLAGRLEQEGSSSDPAVRGGIQSESLQVGLAMQHLGALLLELGRTIMTLRMGQSPAESSVNAGPAVYISPSGPNPIMVQPFPLQTSSLFGGAVPSNPTSFGPVGVGSAPRHINIHIHAGTSLAPIVSAVGSRGNGDGTQGEYSNNTGSGSMRVHPVRNVIAAAVPSRPTVVTVPSAAQPGLVVSASQLAPDSVSSSQPPPDSVSQTQSSLVSAINARIRDLVHNMQGQSQVGSGQRESTVEGSTVRTDAGRDLSNEHPINVDTGAEDYSNSLPRFPTESDGSKDQPQHEFKDIISSKEEGSDSSSKAASTCSVAESSNCSTGESPAVPLGLGLGSLERKRRSKQPKLEVKNGGGTNTNNVSLDQNCSPVINGRQILQSLAASSSAGNRLGTDSSELSRLPSARMMENRAGGRQESNDRGDTANVMSQVLQNPALDGLLASISGQTGVGSPNVLRNMLQQLTQSPQIMNTVHQISQQVDSQDLENMFSGSGGRGGGIDLSRMVQQMMPIVSCAFGGGSTMSQPFPAVEPEPLQHDERISGGDKPVDQDVQINIQPVTQMVEHASSPGDVFHAIVENAAQLHGTGNTNEDLMNELFSNEGLATEYAEMLRRDLCQRFEDDLGQEK